MKQTKYNNKNDENLQTFSSSKIKNRQVVFEKGLSGVLMWQRPLNGARNVTIWWQLLNQMKLYICLLYFHHHQHHLHRVHFVANSTLLDFVVVLHDFTFFFVRWWGYRPTNFFFCFLLLIYTFGNPINRPILAYMFT